MLLRFRSPQPNCATVGHSRLRSVQRLDALASQLPKEAARSPLVRHVEQVAGRPFQHRRLCAPGVEEQPRVIDRPPPRLRIDRGRALALKARPRVEIAGRHIDKPSARSAASASSADRPQLAHETVTERTPFWRMFARVIGGPGGTLMRVALLA